MTGYDACMSSRPCRFLAVAFVCIFAAGEAWPQDAGSVALANLSSTQIVEQMLGAKMLVVRGLHRGQDRGCLRLWRVIGNFRMIHEGMGSAKLWKR